MTAILKVDTIQDTAGNNIINENSNTITIGASGDTTNIIGTLQNNGSALNFATVNGITEADQWRKTAVQEFSTGDVTSNLERVDDANYGKIGTGMTESSGVFTFPSTGTYMVMVNAAFYSTSGSGNSRYIIIRTQITTNNSSYTNVAMAIDNSYNFQNNVISQNASSTIFFNVTDTSTHKVKFTLSAATPTGYYLQGSTSNNETMFTFIRMGDST
jgi:hypothetical protein